MKPSVNDFVTIGPNKSVGDRSYNEMLLLVIRTNGQHIHAKIIADHSPFSRDWWNGRAFISLCVSEYDFAPAWSLATDTERRRAILFRQF